MPGEVLGREGPGQQQGQQDQQSMDQAVIPPSTWITWPVM